MKHNGKMKNCSCHEKWNLPMLMCDESFTEHWIECDFCSNKTAKYKTEEVAEFKWNEFQHKKGIAVRNTDR